MLEVVSVWVTDALLFHLLNFCEKLDQHLLSTFLASHLVLHSEFFNLLFENLVELLQAICSDLRITYKASLHFLDCRLLSVLDQSLKVGTVGRQDQALELVLHKLNGCSKSLRCS